MHTKVEDVQVFGVDYAHYDLGDEGDLYVTEYGLPFVECLFPENHWLDKEWFEAHSERLPGTSSLFRVATKPVNGRQREVVVKWNRMGQEIPGDEFVEAQFNSPFEEFSLVMDLRRSQRSAGPRVYTQKPLAIFVPAAQVELWRTGRKEHVMQSKIDQHVEIELDVSRLYAVIYEWIKGIDAVQGCERGLLSEEEMVSLTLSAAEHVEAHGFEVLDRKPHHVILRPVDGELLRDRDGGYAYALVDYELLRHTFEREEEVRHEKRSDYLRKQRDRFVIQTPKVLPSHLHYAKILGVGYIYGRAHSTGGELYVVGHDPDLFDYFLPERWENSPRVRLSAAHEIYHTVTRDNIHLVWKMSLVGIRPDMDPFKESERQIMDFGYNSPFEEVELALRLSQAKIPTTYPRAIYVSGVRSDIPASLLDGKRYETHRHLLSPSGEPILSSERDYLNIWGYWNGPDDMLAARDEDHFEGVNALRAWRDGVIGEQEYVDIMERTRRRLLQVGVEDLNLRGTHILLSRRLSTGELIRDPDGRPEARICSFELLRARPEAAALERNATHGHE